jgi:hypothetical protein
LLCYQKGQVLILSHFLDQGMERRDIFRSGLTDV